MLSCSGVQQLIERIQNFPNVSIDEYRDQNGDIIFGPWQFSDKEVNNKEFGHVRLLLLVQIPMPRRA